MTAVNTKIHDLLTRQNQIDNVVIQNSALYFENNIAKYVVNFQFRVIGPGPLLPHSPQYTGLDEMLKVEFVGADFVTQLRQNDEVKGGYFAKTIMTIVAAS